MLDDIVAAREKLREIEEKASCYDPDALYDLARIYQNPIEGTWIDEQDLDKALWYYCASVWEAHKIGKYYRSSAYWAARLLYFGTGNNRDTEKAYHYFKYAADAGHTLAMVHLGCYHLGRPPMTEGCGFDRIPALGTKYLTQAASLGSVQAMLELGVAYLQGNGVVRDEFDARDWFVRAAELGDVRAMYNAAIIFEKAYEYDQAGYWFNASAQNGYQNAQRAIQNYMFNQRKGTWEYRY